MPSDQCPLFLFKERIDLRTKLLIVAEDLMIERIKVQPQITDSELDRYCSKEQNKDRNDGVQLIRMMKLNIIPINCCERGACKDLTCERVAPKFRCVRCEPHETS
jgi:hypothetical protein